MIPWPTGGASLSGTAIGHGTHDGETDRRLARVARDAPGRVDTTGRTREASVATTVELYLRDQVIRGELRTEAGRRAVDVLNESPIGVISLGEASARSVHVKGRPTRL